MILDYLTQAAMQTLRQLAVFLGPILLLGFVLDALSRFVRVRAATVFGQNAYTWFTAPGVMIHELGHAFFCIIFGHKIVRMQLFAPRADGTLGVVEHSFNPRNPYQRVGNFFIATGPLWFGAAVVCLLAYLLLGGAAAAMADQVTSLDTRADLLTLAPRVAELSWQFIVSLLQPASFTGWPFWLFAYMAFCIGSHITLSPADLHGALRGFVSLVAALLLFNLLTLRLLPALPAIFSERVLEASVIFYAAMGFVICLNVGLAMIVFALSSATRRLR